MTVQDDDEAKFMTWPLTFARPGEQTAPNDEGAMRKSANAAFENCQVTTQPEQVVAVREFSDASMEPVVRKNDRLLREALARDGIAVEPSSSKFVQFAQYDAIFSMGKRRGEVWITLEDGSHPW